MKIAIGLPTQEMMWSNTTMSLYGMGKYNSAIGLQDVVINQQMGRIEASRNTILKGAMDAGCDYILWIDSDMTFPYNTTERLINRDKDIIGCNAMKRNDSGELAIPKDHFGKPFLKKTEGIRQVKFIGMAVTLIKMSVFDKLEDPYYYAHYVSGGWCGEDQCFCDEARHAGYSIWCDWDLSKEIGHIGQKEYRI